MTPSRRFVVASFFAAIALSALCNSIFNIIDSSFSNPLIPVDIVGLFYSMSLMMFMIKYFVDDVIDDHNDEAEKTTRNSLALMVIAWTLFILAALFAKDIFSSSLLWAAGLISITIFLYKNRKLVEHHARLYLIQNGLLIVILISLAIATFNCALITRPVSMPLHHNASIYVSLITGILTLFNTWFFVVLLRDDTSSRN